MTREEARRWLEAMKSSYALPIETYEAIDMAIEALKTDDVSREAHYDAVANRITDMEERGFVSVVRCKDCINYETCNLRLSHWWKGGYTVDIEFCSFGERREP